MAVAIFDANYLLHRVMHVPSLRMLATKEGKPTGGVFGMIKSLRSTLWEYPECNRVIAVFDGGHSARRKEILPGYKVRKKKDDVDPDGLTYIQKFRMQFNYLMFLLPRLGVKVIRVPRREADDVIGLLSVELDDPLKLVVTDDRDMLQLVKGDVHVWRPIAEELVTESNFEEVVKGPQGQWLLRKAVLGDDSDKIPGIPGVGKVTVDEILGMCSSVLDHPYEEFFEMCLEVGSNRSLSIVEHMDIVLRNVSLIEISREQFSDLEIEGILDAARSKSNIDIRLVKRLFQSFEFFSLIEDFSSWVTRFQLLR